MKLSDVCPFLSQVGGSMLDWVKVEKKYILGADGLSRKTTHVHMQLLKKNIRIHLIFVRRVQLIATAKEINTKTRSGKLTCWMCTHKQGEGRG